MLNIYKKIKEKVVKYKLLRFKLVCFLLFFSLLISVVININVTKPYHTYKLGEFADSNIKANHSIEFEDEEATEASAKEAEKHIPPVFDYDPDAYASLVQRVHGAFKVLRQNPSNKEGKEVFEKNIGRAIDNNSYKLIFDNLFSWRIEKALLYLVSAASSKYIIENRELILGEGSGELIIQDVTKPESERNYQAASSRLKVVQVLQNSSTMDEARKKIDSKMSEIAAKFTGPEKKVIAKLASGLIGPNLKFNSDKTKQLRYSTRGKVNKVIIRVNRGEIIARDGEPIDRRQLLILSHLRSSDSELNSFVYYLFHFFIIFLTFYSISVYSRFSLYINKPKTKDVLALGSGIIVFTVFYKVWLFLASLLSGYFIGLPNDIFLFLFPYVGLAFLFRVIFSTEIAALASIAAVVVVGLMTEGNFGIAGYALFSSFIGIVGVRKFEQRSSLLRAGVYTGVFQMLFAAAIILTKVYTLNFSWYHIIYSVGAGLISGLISALVAEAIVPVFEHIFNYTTNLKLLEFANSTNVLLRDLLVKAPGTYHHSMLVGQLAGAGAEAIGANALLARVGAFYHDIGKIGKAQYFIENQNPGMNPHNKLNPTMSARILVSHAKDGVKLAKENKLGASISDIVEQHHGTSLMKFFYRKAMDLNKNDEQAKTVDPMDYRYPGPKPKSKEAILVMIADSCEAACRSLEDPTPSRIQTTVNAIINNMFVDGQFDESNITLKRLKVISQVYTKTLISINHTRIEYPEIKAEERYGDFSERRRGDKVTQEISDTDGEEGSPETKL